jgi:ATP-binding cassette, subfamily B, bacterial
MPIFDKKRLIPRIRKLGLTFPLRPLLLAVPLVAVSIIGPLITPYLTGRVIDGLLSGADQATLYLTCAAIIVILLLSALASVVSSRMVLGYGYALSRQLSQRVYDALLRMPYLSYSTINSGVLVSRLTSDVRMVEPIFVEAPIGVFRAVLTLLCIATVLLVTEPWYFVVFAVAPFSFVMVRFSQKKIDDYIGRSFEYGAELSALIESSTHASVIALMRQARATARQSSNFATLSTRTTGVAAFLDFWRYNITTAYNLSFAIFATIVLLVAVYLVGSGVSTVGAAVTALLYLNLARAPLSEIQGLRYPIYRASVGLKRLEDVLFSPIAGLTSVVAPSLPATVAARPEVPVVAFESVSYAYPSRAELSIEGLSNVGSTVGASGFVDAIALTRLKTLDPAPDDGRAASMILSDVSFAISKGQVCAIAGRSGSGKSTVAALACGLIRPTSGRILLNGADTATLAEEEIWAHLAYVSQDTYLRDSTLRENLSYFHPAATEAELMDACAFAGIADLVRSLPDGLDTATASNGARFSGGERQRISLARAVLKNTDLLILDEATSHLDAERESDIIGRIAELASQKAIMIIAHSREAVARTSIIHLLEGGRIVESGAHAALLAAGGAYARNFKAGFKDT